MSLEVKNAVAKSYSISGGIIQRTEEIQAFRMKLPVCGMEQEIVEAVRAHDVVIVCGETGSGKSTQIPQFLYEAGYSTTTTSNGIVSKGGQIVITQPRRVATVSTCERVASELGVPMLPHSPVLEGSLKDAVTITSNAPKALGLVGYQIRHDATAVNQNTQIKFVTDGILLKEMGSDLLLRKYNVVIIDEAHERTINTDVLLGLISRLVSILIH